MARGKVRLGLLQMRIEGGRKDNLEKCMAMIDRAASGGANIVCLLSSSPPSTSRGTSRRAGSRRNPRCHVLPTWQPDLNRTHWETSTRTQSLSNPDRLDTNSIDLIQSGPTVSYAVRRSWKELVVYDFSNFFCTFFTSLSTASPTSLAPF
jgi:hypothetical protein